MGLRGSCCDLCWGVLCLWFPLGVFQFLTLHLGLWSLLGLFSCVVLWGVLLHVALQFSSTFPFSILLVEEAFFFPVYILASLSVAGWPWLLGLSLGFLSCYLVPLVCVFVFCAGAIQSWLLWLCDVIWALGAWLLQFIFLLRIVWLFRVFWTCRSWNVLFWFRERRHW